MLRFLAVLLAAFACAFSYLVVTGLALPQAATARAMFVVSSVALVLSAAAMTVAVATAAGSRAQQTRLQNLARSVDAALHDLASRKDGDAAAHLTEAPTRPLGAVKDDLAQQAVADRGRPIEIAVARPRALVHRAGRDPVTPAARSAATVTDAAFWLRPLLSVATGNVAGFDVLALTPDKDGVSRNRAASERSLVLGAIEAASRPGFAGERMPLHVTVTEALLADRTELATVVDALGRLNGSARTIVLSLPTRLMEKPAQHSAALARLAAGGPRFCAEGWPGSERDVEALWRSGVTFLRLPTARLLRGAMDSSKAVSMIRMLAASGMTAIATDLRTQADVTELAGFGITLTTPAAVSEPVPPKAANGAGVGDVIHI
jgi:hypothetical protein